MPRLSVRTLGGVQIHVDGRPVDDFRSRKTCALLLYLAVRSEYVHQRIHLAGLLWPDSPEQTARTYLRQSLAALRDILNDRAAPRSLLLTTRQTIQLNPQDDFWLDAGEVLSRLEAATGPRRRAMTPDLASEFGDAVALYGGEFLEGFHLDDCPEFGEWQLLTGEQIRRQVIETLERLTRWRGQQQAVHTALPFARRRVELDPLSEEGQRQYMRLLALCGERSAALAHYDQYCELLFESLHTKPVPATTALADRIRSGEIGVDVTPPGAGVVTEMPPYLQKRSTRGTEPLVARERELERLDRHLTDVVSGSAQGRVLFVVGAAGQGKSALMSEFSRRATVAHEDLLMVAGQSASHGGIGDPLLPFRQVSAQLTGDLRMPWAAGHLDETQVRRLWAAFPRVIRLLLDTAPDLVGSLVPQVALRQRIESLPSRRANALLAALTDRMTQTSSVRQPGIFEQYARLLHELSVSQPLLLLLDDLHWADRDSLSLLFHLGHQLEASRILVLGAFRPEEILSPPPESPHPLQIVYQELQRSGYAPVDLDDVDGRMFVDAFLDREANELGTEFRKTVHRLTGGSPLFTSELVHSMQENGDLVRTSSGAWAEAPSLSWDAMTTRVEAVLGRRVAQLSPSQRELLMASSVQGEQFLAEVVAAALERPAIEVTVELSGAVERHHRLALAEGVERVGEFRLARYRFRHALFQQYLYAELDPVERAQLHESTARALEALYSGHADGLAPIAGRLAWHWRQAESPDRSIAYHVQAGDWAVRLSAYAQAQDHYERGLALLEQTPQRNVKPHQELEVLTRLAEVQSMLYGGASSQVEATLGRARHLHVPGSGEDGERFPLANRIWAYHHQRGDNREAYRLALSCLQIAEQSDRPELMTQAYSNLGTSLLRLGRMTSALDHFVRAREMGDAWAASEGKTHTSDSAIIIRVSEAVVLWYLGFPAQAAQRNAEAIGIAEEQENTYRLVFALVFACGLYARARKWDKVFQYAERTHSLCIENNFRMWKAVACLYRAWALASLDDCRTGVALAEAALQDIGQTELLHVRYISVLADIYTCCGRADDAFSTTGRSIAVMNRTDEREWEPEVHRLHGELLLSQNAANAGMAESQFGTAIDVARSQQSRMLELRAVTSLCELWRGQGKTGQARDRLSECYAWFTEGLDTPDLAAARGLLDRLNA